MIERNIKMIVVYGCVLLALLGCSSEKESSQSKKNSTPKFEKQITVLSSDSLKKLSPSELRILRNEVFAKYGYQFSSEDLQRHFSKFDWYKPTSGNVSKHLTNSERRYVALIKRIELSKQEAVSVDDFNDYEYSKYIGQPISALVNDLGKQSSIIPNDEEDPSPWGVRHIWDAQGIAANDINYGQEINNTYTINFITDNKSKFVGKPLSKIQEILKSKDRASSLERYGGNNFQYHTGQFYVCFTGDENGKVKSVTVSRGNYLFAD